MMTQETIYLSIGSNINRRHHLKLALEELFDSFGPMQLSPVYQSASVGFDGNDFYNMVVGFATDVRIADLVSRLKEIEKLSGRDYSAPKFSDRTLDIDLLNYGQEVCTKPIILPRDEITYHAFVLQPLYDIAPSWVHPVKGKTIKQIWNEFDQQQQKLKAIDDPIDMSKYCYQQQPEKCK